MPERCCILGACAVCLRYVLRRCLLPVCVECEYCVALTLCTEEIRALDAAYDYSHDNGVTYPMRGARLLVMLH